MASTLLEQTRALHEDLESMERLIVKDFKQETKTHKDKLMQSHRVRKRLDHMQDSARKLVKIYNDDDNSRREEIASLAGNNQSNVFSVFYDRLKEVRDYYRRFPNHEITQAEDEEVLLKEEPQVEFTGEECLGRYLDLHELFLTFVNSQFGKKLEYFEYVSSFHNFSEIRKGYKLGKGYRDYLQSLLHYLTSFYQRTQPLVVVEKIMTKVEEDFEKRWEAREVSGWEDRGLTEVGTANTGLDLDAFDTVQELEALGAERLKEALQVMGLKCGGTLSQRAERLFATRGKAGEQLDRRLFAKGVLPPLAQLGELEAAKVAEAARQAGLLEAKISRLVELLVNVISDTKGRIEKKLAQTYEEMVAEQEEAEAEMVPEMDSDEEEYIYNPLKLPLGWDGKPIPYWLYKLHGLNQEFKCEICGNYSYWGRRAFERHFKEWRHQNGMRALGIPNNKNFYEVTQIEDALSLWRTIQERQRGGFKAEMDEEFEDRYGNVYNRKTYEDMKRQGLID